MAELRPRWRLVLGWVLTLGIVAYAISDWGSPETAKIGAVSEEAEEPVGLRIVSISDGEVNPGDAVVVKYANAGASPELEARVAKKPAQILSRDEDTLVVEIPPTAPPGKAALRLLQGTTKSKGWDLHIRSANHKKLVARLLGGLALFVLGLGLLALGLRGLAGNRLRTLLGKLTGSPARALGVGALVGTGTQLTSSSAAFTVSLVDARMLRLGPAVAVLAGAQLGASITGALIPVQLSSESLLVIVIGVLWSRLARTRRGTSFANVVLGAGLMLYGLHLLQTSVEPLVSDPKLLPYVGHLRESTLEALALCAVTGALLAFVLQGPGPVYVLVVGLAQTTTTIPFENALAVIAGANLGAGLAMALIAWARSSTRPLAAMHVMFAFTATIIALATIPIWTRVTGRFAPETLSYGHSVVRTRIAAQLAIGLIGSQLVVGLLWLFVLPKLVKRVAVVKQRTSATASSPFGAVLSEALGQLRVALEIAVDTACAEERGRSSDADHALRAARDQLEARYQAFGSEAAAEREVRAVVAALQLQRAIEQAVHVSELCVERGVRIGEDTKQRLTSMATIANESFDAVLAAAAYQEAPDLEEAVAREIRMNALEAEGRTLATARRKRADSTSSTTTSSLQIGIAELVDGFENVGNHLFRLAKALADDVEH